MDAPYTVRALRDHLLLFDQEAEIDLVVSFVEGTAVRSLKAPMVAVVKNPRHNAINFTTREP